MSILGTCPECLHHTDGMCDLRPRICLNYDHFERRPMVTLTRDDFEKLYISRAAYDELNAKVAALQAALDAAINMNIEKNAEVVRLTAALRDANEDAEARVVELEDRLSEIVAYGGYYADIEKHVPPDGQVVKVIASSSFGVDDFTALRMDGKWYFDYDQPREVPSGFEIIRIKPWDVKLFSATDDEEF